MSNEITAYMPLGTQEEYSEIAIRIADIAGCQPAVSGKMN
jgi:hypothetical protein